MKYRGDFKKLEKLGYSLDSTEEYYVKQIHKAVVYINTKTKHIYYSGQNSRKLLDEIVTIKKKKKKGEEKK